MIISRYSIVKLNMFRVLKFLPSRAYVDKLLIWNLQIEVLSQDEGDVSQNQEIQELQVICNLPTHVSFLSTCRRITILSIYFCTRYRSLTRRYNNGLKERKEIYAHCCQHYNT